METAGRRSRAEWVKLVAEFEKSDDSASGFASSRGLKANTLGWWRWKLRSERVVAQFAEVIVADVAEAPAPARGMVEVEFLSGVRLRFEHAVDADGLGALADAFEGGRR